MQHNAFLYPRKNAIMKNLLVSLLVLASVNLAHADNTAADQTQRLVGSCVAVQSARLDDGSQSLEVLSKAVVAGCMPILRTALARNNAPQMTLASTGLLRNAVSDEFGIEDVLQDMAVSAIGWFRGPGRTHVAALRGADLAAR